VFGEPDDRRYLLFDSGCALCARVATELEAEAGGRLVARSLGDPAIQALLHKTKASPRWEPAVLEERRGHWRTAVRIMGTQELSGAALGEARGALWEAQDTRELGWALTQLGLQTQASAVGAAQHELETGNTLLAVAAIWQATSGAGYVLNHYALRHAVRGFRSSSSLYRVEAETVRLIASSGALFLLQ